MNTTFARSYTASASLHAAIGLACAALYWCSTENIVVRSAEPILTLLPTEQREAIASFPLPRAPSVRLPAIPKITRVVQEQIPVVSEQPTSVPESAPKRVRIETFRQEHPFPQPSAVPRADYPPSVFVRLNPKDFAVHSADSSDGNSKNSGSATTTDIDFVAKLVEQLRNSYSDREAAHAGLSALIEFSVRAEGSLWAIRLVESSGSGEYDTAVISSVRRVRVADLPSGVVGKTYRVQFRASNGE